MKEKLIRLLETFLWCLGSVIWLVPFVLFCMMESVVGLILIFVYILITIAIIRFLIDKKDL